MNSVQTLTGGLGPVLFSSLMVSFQAPHFGLTRTRAYRDRAAGLGPRAVAESALGGSESLESALFLLGKFGASFAAGGGHAAGKTRRPMEVELS